MSALVLKVAWNSELRRISVPKEYLNLAFLQQKIAGMFSLPDKTFQLKYVDGDDYVALASNEDCSKAFNLALKQQPPILRVVVEEKLPEEAPAIEFPVPEVTQSVSGFICSVCMSELSQVHYKCLNCINFELCEQCEETGQHHPHHLLVKLRVPISTYPVKQQLIFTAHIEDDEQKKIAKLQKQYLQEEDKQTKLKARELKKLEKEAEKFKRMQEKEEQKQQKLAEKEAKKHIKRNKNKQAALNLANASPDDSLVWMDIPSTTPLNDSLFNPGQVLEEPQQSPSVEHEPVPETTTITQAIINEEPLASPEASSQTEDNAISELMSEFQDVSPGVVVAPQEVEEPESTLNTVVATVVDEKQETEKEMELVVADSSPQQEEQQQQAASNLFKQNLARLEEMGFTDKDKNIKLLVENRGDLDATLDQLLHARSWFPEFFPFRF